MGDNMSNLSELADEYLLAAKDLEKKIESVKHEDYKNEQLHNRKLAVYEDMRREAMFTYKQLKNYYED